MPKPVKEIVADRTATTSTWQSADGTLTVRKYLAPHFYKSASGGYLPFDPVLEPMPGQTGWWHSVASSFGASFGPAGAAGGAEQLSVPGAQLGFEPLGVASPSQAPSVSGGTAAYDGLWPGADLTEQVLPSGMKEDIVLTGPGAEANFSFRLAGATARPDSAGGLTVLAGGRQVGTVPPLTVGLQAPRGNEADATIASGARLSVSDGVVSVSVSKSWLDSLSASAFPVVIDPTFFATVYTSASQVVSVSSTGSVDPDVMQVGYSSQGGQWSAAAYFTAPTIPAQEAGAPPWQLSSASFSASCDKQCSLSGLGEYGLSTPAPTGADPEYPTYSQIPASDYPLAVYSQSSGVSMPFGGQNATVLDAYLATRSDGWWIGMTASAASEPGASPSSLATLDPNDVYLALAYVEQPPPTKISSPASGSVVATATPTLTAVPVSDPDARPSYDFRVSASPNGTGAVADSGWQSQDSWTVPPGTLQDGVSYYATVLDSITDQWNLGPGDLGYVPPAAPAGPSSFTIRERLGAGGPSPTDTVGSPPQGTSTPSQGTPSPGAGTASETVNLVTGDLSVAVGTPQMQTLAGPAGITLTYDSMSASASSGTDYGLTGKYYPDDGTHSFNGALAGQRPDSGVDAVWPPGQSAIAGLTEGKPFMARWTGWLTLPPGTWQLGGITTGGMRVYLAGSPTPVYDDWDGAAPQYAPQYETSTVSGGQQYQVEVDDWEPYTSDEPIVQFWARDTAITNPDTPSAFVVPSGWLTPVATGVPPGWSLQANASTVQWTHADDQGSQVVLQGTGGDTETFPLNALGMYQTPAGSSDYLRADGTGRLQLSTAGGDLYTFNPDGSMASMTTAADDRHPAALQYTYSGSPALLRGITDPVSQRSITLSYGGDSGACPLTGAQSLAGNQQAPTGMLCQVTYWDGTSAVFGYAGSAQLPQLASVEASGGETSSFAYDSDNRLSDIRDALANDYLAAGGQAGTPVSCGDGLLVAPTDTQICYDSSGRVFLVAQPAPTPGVPRPGRTYTYAPAADGSGSTYVQIAGFTPSDAIAGAVSGYAERTDYDTQGRIIRQTDSAGHATTTMWFSAPAAFGYCGGPNCGQDEPAVAVDAAGEQTSTVYDQFGNITDTYGPAPVGCFSGSSWPPGVTPIAPVQGYLPVANPPGTAGCGVAVPHTHNGYDEAITGLAATYWPDDQFAGAPALHATGTPGSPGSGFCASGAGVCALWQKGTAPVADPSNPSDPASQWSVRLTGFISLSYSACPHGYQFVIDSSQPATLTIDGNPLIVDDPPVPGQEWGADSGDPSIYTTGPHEIEADFQGSASQLSEFSLSYACYTDPTPPSSVPPVPASMLDPGYNLKTSTTDADGDTTTITYSNASIGPQYGLPTSTTVGARSSTPLTTTTTYMAPGPTSYLQRTSTSLPAGNTTTFQNYGGTDPPIVPACGVNSTTPQGGQRMQQSDPDPGNGQALVKQFIYDPEGRQAGVRAGTPSDIGTAPWQCTSYDSRGRLAQETFPAANGSPARTVTYAYSVGGNPLISSASDPSGTITSTVDLLGRVTSYTDVWGQTTTTSYNQAGQVTATSGPGGSYQLGYDPNSGQPTTTTVNGTLLATASYDADDRLTGVAYGNGTSSVVSYDAYGNQDGLTYDAPGGGALAADTVTRTVAGRVSTETASHAGGPVTVSYAYDGAGRLTQADDTSGGTLDSSYSYAASPSCPSQNAGENTNRTSVTIGTATTSYCYNTADQVVSSTAGGTTSTSYAYNERGDQTDDNGNTYTWDSSDRVATATAGTTTTTSSYDAVDRLIQSASTAGGAATVRYSYAGYTDNPAAVLSTGNAILQQLVGLPGGVTVILQSSGNVWSYTNLQGDTTATASGTGTLTSGPVTYDPWGNLNPGQTAPANTAGPNTLGAYAASGKLTNASTRTILLGARTFNPTEARFLSVDPVLAGCANPYTYAFGDPLNNGDLSGEAGLPRCDTLEALPAGPGYVRFDNLGKAGIEVTLRFYPEEDAVPMQVTASTYINGQRTVIAYSKLNQDSDYLFHFKVSRVEYPGQPTANLAPGSILSIRYNAIAEDPDGTVEVWSGTVSCKV